jgi:leucyl/phenylalanyl-tRNA--protein transferase
VPQDLTTDLILYAYSIGVFPMADSRESTHINWIEPRLRGIFPLNHFHVSKSLARTILRQPFQVTVNTAFADVVSACADRDETWINHDIQARYTDLFHLGHAHSIEVWDDSHLVGGVYGISIGAAFFGESMFSKRTNASKIALAYLVHRLSKSGFELFDTQFITPHLASLGAIEIPKEKYKILLADALSKSADFDNPDYCSDVFAIAHRNTHTS